MLRVTERTPLTASLRLSSSVHADGSPHQENALLDAVSESYFGRRSSYLDPGAFPRKIALATSCVAASCAGAAFVPISLVLPAGPFFAAANFIGYCKLDMWAIRGTIDDLFGPKKEKEVILIKRAASNKCVTISAVTTAIVIALLSQVPIALPSLEYDGNLKIPALISLFIGGSLIPIRSLQLSFNKSLQMRNCQTSARTEHLRTTLQTTISTHLETFRKIDRSAQIQHIDRLSQINGTEIEQTKRLLEEILTVPSEVTNSQNGPAFRYGLRLVGLWIAVSLLAARALYTFAKTKIHVINNNVVAGTLAGAVVLSGAYLSGQSIMNTLERVGIAFFNMICNRRDSSIAEQLRPRLVASLKFFGAIANLGALGTTVVIWTDFFKDSLPAKIYFTSTLCLAFFLFLSTATFDLIDEAVEKYVKKMGDDEDRKIVEFTEKLKDIKKMIGISSPLDLDTFVQGLPAEVQAKLQQ